MREISAQCVWGGLCDYVDWLVRHCSSSFELFVARSKYPLCVCVEIHKAMNPWIGRYVTLTRIQGVENMRRPTISSE